MNTISTTLDSATFDSVKYKETTKQEWTEAGKALIKPIQEATPSHAEAIVGAAFTGMRGLYPAHGRRTSRVPVDETTFFA